MLFTHWTTPYGWVAPLTPWATGQYFFMPCIKCSVYLNFNNDFQTYAFTNGIKLAATACFGMYTCT